MDTRTLLIILLVAFIAIIGVLLLGIRSREGTHFDKNVVATISQIKVEASSISSWWVVIAQWRDPQSGQILIFRSHRLKDSPKQRVGDPITVEFDPRQPKHHRMLFEDV
jgi:hypothetical protein